MVTPCSRKFIRYSISALAIALWAGQATASAKIWEQVSGEKALEHVRQLVELGPRPPGSDAIEKSRAYIEKQLEALGWQVTRQAFADDTPQGKIEFVNLLAQFRGKAAVPETAPKFLLCSHYDTKLFGAIRFVGANDSGSSTGLLLELARVLAQDESLAVKTELVFFDGEEAYENFSETDGLYGSRHFAEQLKKNKLAKRYRGGVVFDMVGERSLKITLPPDSPPQIAQGILASAEALKLRDYFTYFDRPILDDHSPLNAIGIPTIDLIDFDFAWWHTAEDTLDKLSAESLRVVGSVATYYLSELADK